MMQQDGAARRPKLSLADSVLLKLIFRSLGDGHFLAASPVCRAWREAYGISVDHSTLTSFKPYLQDAAMWKFAKELGLDLKNVSTALIGEYATGEAFTEGLAIAQAKKPPPASPLSRSEQRMERQLQVIRARQPQHIQDEYAEEERQALAQRQMFVTATVMTEMAIGAAKRGRIAVVAEALRHMPDTQMCMSYNVVQNLADCAARYKDTATFNNAVRTLFVLSQADLPRGSAVRSSNAALDKWHIAAECHEQCDRHRPLQELAELYHKAVSGCNDSDATTAAVNSVSEMWSFHSSAELFTSALQRHSAPLLLYAHYISECPQHVSDVIYAIARSGNTDVLEHVFEAGLLSEHAVIEKVVEGAIDRDCVETVKWLQLHALVHDDSIKQQLNYNRAIKAYFAESEVPGTAAAAGAAPAEV
jgi:hypothetical protein